MIDKLPKELCHFVKYLTPEEMIKFACLSKRYLLIVRLYLKYKRRQYEKNNIPMNYTNSLVKINRCHYYYTDDMLRDERHDIANRLRQEGIYEKIIQIKRVFEHTSRGEGILTARDRIVEHSMYRCYYNVLAARKKCGDKRYVYPDWNYLDLSLIKNEDLIPYK
tara:strand:+ start:512 stop:1003 length:492 start_codon:yes stop_codon:yes gene_type:complete